MLQLKVLSEMAKIFLVATLLVFISTNLLHAQDDLRASNEHASRCRSILHYEVIEKDNCSLEVPVLSCGGTCHSEATPIIYFQRPEDSSSPFNHECECCSIIDAVSRHINLELNCTHNNSIVQVKQFFTFATKCACTDCESL